MSMYVYIIFIYYIYLYYISIFNLFMYIYIYLHIHLFIYLYLKFLVLLSHVLSKPVIWLSMQFNWLVATRMGSGCGELLVNLEFVGM